MFCFCFCFVVVVVVVFLGGGVSWTRMAGILVMDHMLSENTDTILIGRMILIGIILGAVFGGILLASVCCTVIYCACLRNKTRQDNTGVF